MSHLRVLPGRKMSNFTESCHGKVRQYGTERMHLIKLIDIGLAISSAKNWVFDAPHHSRNI